MELRSCRSTQRLWQRALTQATTGAGTWACVRWPEAASLVNAVIAMASVLVLIWLRAAMVKA